MGLPTINYSTKFACGARRRLSGLRRGSTCPGDWQPTKAVEIVVPAGAGGAADQMARTIQGHRIEAPVDETAHHGDEQVRRKRAEGIMDVKDAKRSAQADGGVLRHLHAAGCSQPAVQLRDLNPVAMIALDEFLLWVNVETPYMTRRNTSPR